jgi:hypothetical protein
VSYGRSCGYVIEGHVPASAIRQLLEKGPAAVGLAVPGMLGLLRRRW